MADFTKAKGSKFAEINKYVEAVIPRVVKTATQPV